MVVHEYMIFFFIIMTDRYAGKVKFLCKVVSCIRLTGLGDESGVTDQFINH